MNIGVILAGGSGTRMGNIDKPKQFIEVYGKPLIIYTLEAFEASEYIEDILISCHEEWIEQVVIWCRKYEITKAKYVIKGGETRQASTLSALNKLKGICQEDDIVVIHDSARPLITNRIIKDNVKFTKEYDAVDTVIPCDDTIIKSLNNKTISNVPVRKELYVGQTPQSFKFNLIMESHLNALDNNVTNATDDCQLVLKYGKDVHLVQGDKLNLKITNFEDLTLFKAILKASKIGGQ
jgi:2-C-methyl-D-erythritol 4-phosphate cytidylyltransferase